MLLNSLNKVFKNILHKNVNGQLFTSLANANAQFHHLQEEALKENCILVDENDVAIGASSKKNCHLVNSDGQVKLHRAFSVYLFNTDGDLLIQRRSLHKVTFPDTYTNTCCSHPLFDIENERDEVNAMGIRRAAQRRLNYELGIPLEEIQPEDFHYITRIHYQDIGDGIWGEHEIAYMLFLQKDLKLNPNENEVSEIRYIKKSELDNEILKLDAPLTPWFNLILKNSLKLWWNNLNNLKNVEDVKNIQRY